MALDFPNNPSENDTYLDGRLWLFKDGYWQETIVSFSIDLLRDVHTIFDTQTIIFVDENGFESSVDANQDFPFILADDSVSNISFTPYDLPFYIADGTYDGIDVVKYDPALNSVMVWDGKNWIPQVLTYQTSDIIGLDLNTSITDDVMIWDTDKYVPDSKNNHTLYDIYDDKDICIIEGSILPTTLDFWYDMDYTSTLVDSTGTQADLTNNRILCKSNGTYEISQAMDNRSSYLNNNAIIYYIMEFTVYDSLNQVKHQYDTHMGIRYDVAPVYNSLQTFDYVNLVVGDYLEFRIQRYLPSGGWPVDYITTVYSMMYMKKIGNISEV